MRTEDQIKRLLESLTGEPYETLGTDQIEDTMAELLADLMLMADHSGSDFNYALELAQQHFEAEKAEESPEPADVEDTGCPFGCCD